MSDSPFSNRVRVRVNGLLVRQRSLLMVKMNTPTMDEPFWMPPGGGLKFGETMEEAVRREMKEETGLQVKVNELQYVSEYVRPPWHAVEFYFNSELIDGEVALGEDPELIGQIQYLQDIKFISFKDFPSFNIAPPYLKEHFVQDYISGKKETTFYREEYDSDDD
ncbi:MAG TPA: NUDIX domain-containing protein [Balneolales bacterium]|nr:NUDIX domain-containing protein [Balneolales bacterium]